MKKYFHIFLLCFSISSISYSQDLAVIPNVFTPNNDGINDVFKIRAFSNVETLSVSIFNRYGAIVYRYFGLNGTWDGRTHAGGECSDGTYFVVIEFTLTDGSKSLQDQPVQILR
ncbi:MAG: gliding motility-associated C-terminal domain-containing protein [Crocinitomicaceae bacterium]